MTGLAAICIGLFIISIVIFVIGWIWTDINRSSDFGAALFVVGFFGMIGSILMFIVGLAVALIIHGVNTF